MRSSRSHLDLMLGGEASLRARVARPEQTVLEYTRRQLVRKALLEALSRVPEIVPPEVQREGLGAFESIGTDVREVLERRPASSVVMST